MLKIAAVYLLFHYNSTNVWEHLGGGHTIKENYSCSNGWRPLYFDVILLR